MGDWALAKADWARRMWESREAKKKAWQRHVVFGPAMEGQHELTLGSYPGGSGWNPWRIMVAQLISRVDMYQEEMTFLIQDVGHLVIKIMTGTLDPTDMPHALLVDFHRRATGTGISIFAIT